MAVWTAVSNFIDQSILRRLVNVLRILYGIVQFVQEADASLHDGFEFGKANQARTVVATAHIDAFAG